MGCKAIPVASSDTALRLSSSPSLRIRRTARLLISTWASSLKTLSFHWEAGHSARTVAIACSTLAAHWQHQAHQCDFSATFFSTHPEVFAPSLRGFGGGKQLQIFCYLCGFQDKSSNNCKASNRRFLPLERGRGFDRQKRPTHLHLLISTRTDAVWVTSAPVQAVKPQPVLLSVKYFLQYSHIQ